jgi:hypothetical protein
LDKPELYKRKPFFDSFTGITLVIVLTFIAAIAISKGGIVAAIAFIGMPFILAFLNKVFLKPEVGITTILALGFLAIGILRYLPGQVPLGLSIDAFLFLTYVALFLKSTTGYVPWKNAQSPLTLLAFIWFLYSLFELVNPEAQSKVAWFYAMRGVSLYMLMLIPLVFILYDDIKSFQFFILVWGSLSLLGTLKGMMQLYIGPDFAEQRWLDQGNAVTHILFGKLRVFSFYSDAGQFGAAQGHTGLVFSILASECKIKKRKIFYIIVAVMGFWGMLISGTRGAIAAPGAGFMVYFVLKKNFKLTIAGIVMLALVYVFFRYTMLLNSNPQIRRMRTGFDPNNPSLQVRLHNQEILRGYLKSRPFGGGIGSAGNWGQRFTPNGFLANVPTDSWYVAIWAEQGIVGLYLHLGILFYILSYGSYLIFFKLKHPLIINRTQALTAGHAGIMAVSYGNGVLGQLPTSVLLYTSMAYIFMAPKLEKELFEIEAKQKDNKNHKLKHKENKYTIM